MAFYRNEDEEDQYGQQAFTTGPQSGQLGTSATMPTNGDSSGSFVGIKNYLDANQTQGAKLGDQAANIINTSANQAKTQVNDLTNKFNQDADAGTVNLNEEATNMAKTQAEKLTPDQSNTVKNQYNAAYSGPKSVTDYSDDYLKAQKSVNTASNNVAMQGTEEGRKSLVKQINQNAGKNSRTSGGLDNLLLQAGSGKEKLQTAADQNRGVINSLQEAQDASAQRAAQAQATTAATKQTTRDAIGRMDDPTTPQDEASGAFAGIRDYLAGKASAYDVDAQYRQAMSDVGGNRGTKGDAPANLPNGTPIYSKSGPEELGYEPNEIAGGLFDQLGLQSGQSIYDVDIGNFLARNPQDPTAQMMANADDVARYKALADIAGIDPNWLTAPGSYNPLVVDKEGLGLALQDAEKKFGADYAKANKGLGDWLSTQNPYFLPEGVTNNNPYTNPGGWSQSEISAEKEEIASRYSELKKAITDLEALRDKRTVIRGQS